MPAFESMIYQGVEVNAGQVLIQLAPDANPHALEGVLHGLGRLGALISHGANGQGDTYAVVLDGDRPYAGLLEAIGHLPGVTLAEPDFVIQPFGDADEDPNLDTYDVSNDPGVTGGSTWGLYGDLTPRVNIYGSQAGEAWAAGYTGSTKVAVGLVDSGADYTHPDLYLNIWLNPGEIPAAIKAALTDTDGDGRITFRDLNATANSAYVSDVNGNGRIDAGDLLNDVRWEDGVDQDGDGHKDDLIGWDFVNDDNDPMDDLGHGTHVAGILGANGGNGVGSAGVAWSTEIVVAKILGPSGGVVSDAVRALDYLTSVAGVANLVATNNSWGTSAYSASLQGAVDRGALADVLFVAAAGNGGADQVGDNDDTTPNYPSNLSTTAGAGYEAVIAVAAITNTGTLASYSNYGVGSVDLGAPGSGIYSTLVGGGYGQMSGTSMAAPFVTGAIAVYAAANPGANAAQIRADLLASTIATSSLAGKTVTGGRLDVSSFVYRGSPAGISVTGTSANETITPTSVTAGLSKSTTFNDTLTGGAGNDKLDGGPGFDRLVGGAGNDTFILDNASDVAVELPGEGNDLINTAISYALPANVERLTLTGTAAVDGTGNELANTLIGNGAANRLDGGDGNDILNGGAGADTLVGGMGADKLTGELGADSMAGGAGDDTYDVDDAGDVVVELAGEGADLVTTGLSYTLGANLERLTLTGADPVNGTGNELANTLTGNGSANLLSGLEADDTLSGGDGADTLLGGVGADKLTGGSGADSMAGGTGDDTYDVDDAGDVVGEAAGEGADQVNSAISFALGDNVERLTLTGSAAVSGTGNALDNTLTGNTGDNVLDGAGGVDTLTGGSGNDTLLGGAGGDRLTGGLGADSMAGGEGDDTYYVDDVGDAIFEAAGQGLDIVSSTVSFTLAAEVEKLTLTGSGAINGTGNGLGNTITGNVGANDLDGAGGADTLNGGSGDDTLDGGAGADRLSGGAGADRFVFEHGQAGGDTITDFAAGDHIELHGYGAGSMLAPVAGSTTQWVITDGVTGATEVIALSNKYVLAAGDFVFS
jgi:Ca2+-binding RTX toxin-like protein